MVTISGSIPSLTDVSPSLVLRLGWDKWCIGRTFFSPSTLGFGTAPMGDVTTCSVDPAILTAPAAILLLISPSTSAAASASIGKFSVPLREYWRSGPRGSYAIFAPWHIIPCM